MDCLESSQSGIGNKAMHLSAAHPTSFAARSVGWKTESQTCELLLESALASRCWRARQFAVRLKLRADRNVLSPVPTRVLEVEEPRAMSYAKPLS